MATKPDWPASIELFAAEPPSECDPRIRQPYQYWRAACPQGRLPGRQHIDPVAMPALLPWIWLVDVRRDPLRFKYRLMGTEQVRIMEREVTGQWMDEVNARFVTSPAYPQFVTVAERGTTAYRRGKPLFHISKDYLLMERLLLPLAHDGVVVDMLLAITVYHRDPQSTADP
jgi:hypothetical protein